MIERAVIPISPEKNMKIPPEYPAVQSVQPASGATPKPEAKAAAHPKMIPDPEKELDQLLSENRNSDFQHYSYGEEIRQFILMQRGDIEAVEESQRIMRLGLPIGLSKDPLKNVQYLFIASIAIATRFAIEGGMDGLTAYAISDMYIKKLDQCADEDAVMALHREMFTFFTQKMSGIRKSRVLSRTISQCTEYIDANLHQPQRIDELAELVGLSPGYLSTLFRNETGQTFTDYVMSRRIEEAENRLRYSADSLVEISESLGFSSQSYFIRCFRERTGMTPREYRQKHYGEGLQAAASEAPEDAPDT